MALGEAAPGACSGCSDFAASRRGVLTGLALGGFTTIMGSAAMTISGPAAAASETPGGDSILVVLSLRGAADGLSLVVPHGDPAYYAARPSIAVPKTQLLGADSMFGLHPGLRPLESMWKAGEVAVVNATGLRVANRSHFAAIEEVEDAKIGSVVRSGWLNRLLGTFETVEPTNAVTMGSAVGPTSMFGEHTTLSLKSLGSVQIAGDDPRDARRTRRTSLEQLWSATGGPMAQAVDGAMEVTDAFTPVIQTSAGPTPYPASDLGRAMSILARSIRTGVDVRLATIDSGAWDMHANLGGPTDGALYRNASDLAGSIAAFFADLGPHRSRVTVVTISEFGRRVQENSARGLDHGWGNAMFVLGAGVTGGRYYGRWPGLQNSLDADLAVTTDYRSVLSECIGARFPSASIPSVFPGFKPERVGFMTNR